MGLKIVLDLWWRSVAQVTAFSACHLLPVVLFIADLRQTNVMAASTAQIMAAARNQRLNSTQLGGNQTAASKKTPASPTNPQVVFGHMATMPLPRNFNPSRAAISFLPSEPVKITNDDLEAQ